MPSEFPPAPQHHPLCARARIAARQAGTGGSTGSRPVSDRMLGMDNDARISALEARVDSLRSLVTILGIILAFVAMLVLVGVAAWLLLL